MDNELSILIIAKIEPFLRPYLSQFFKLERIIPMSNEIEIRGIVNKKDAGGTIVIRILISNDYKQVQIPNIFMPEFMREKGIGKTLISLIYEVVKDNGYKLFITDLVPNFYKRLVNRGAIICEANEAVQIIDSTDLSSHY